jgi:hypothetical protein
VIDDPLRAIEKHLPLDAIDRPIAVLLFDPLPVDLFAQDMKPHRLKAIAGIDSRTAPMRRAVGQTIPEGEVIVAVVFVHSEHHPNYRVAASTPT